MKDKFKGILEKIKTFFGKLSKKTRIMLGVGLVAIVAGAIIVALVLNNQPYSVLFTNLGSDEVSSITTYLDDNGITDYQIKDSDTILVPKDQETELKAKLIMKGYPSTGFAYSTYLNNVGSLSTESDRETAFLFELQDRLGAVVKCLDGVKDAWVTIAQGEDRRYVLDSDNIVQASASVMVQMDGTKSLSSQQATAIRNLVAHAVSGLQIDSVTISDTLGNTYNSGDGVSDSSSASQLKMQLEEQVNNSVRTSIMQALTPFYGDDNIRVSVNSTVDVSHSVGKSTTYAQPTWAADGSTNGEGIIGSKVYDNTITRDDGSNSGGTVGTQSNSDVDTYVKNEAKVNGNEKSVSTSGQVDYDVNNNVEQTERTAGVVTDMMVSVSLNSTTAGRVDTKTIMDHVARAAGISTDQEDKKISIMTQPFYKEKTNTSNSADTKTLPSWAIYAAIGGGALLLLLLILIMFLRRKKRKKNAQDALEDRMMAYMPKAQPATAGADIMNMKSEKSMELRKSIRDFADENPEIAAQMVRTWLRGGEENDG